MVFALGVTLFALGILVSVCLHEAGHMWTAKAFGMKVTRYFVGFGPTLWSFRRGETEYGVKAIPAGGFVKVVGMTPLEEEEEVPPADRHRVFWRKPLWQRTIVLAAGSVTHFILAFVLLWVAASFVGLPNDRDGTNSWAQPTRIAVGDCVPVSWKLAPCAPGDLPGAARAAGLRDGDLIIAVNGQPVRIWDDLVTKVRALGGQTATITYERDGETRTTTVNVPLVTRLKQTVEKPESEITEQDLEKVGALGIGLTPFVTVGPVAGAGAAVQAMGNMVVGTFQAIAKFPEKVPKLFDALAGKERDPETPISVVGASRLGGEVVELRLWAMFVMLLAVLNLFVGIFNLFPLLPLDGGHIAIAWFERARSWVYAKLGKPDPGRVDYLKLMPLTYAVIVIFGAFTLLTIAADIVNPISLLR